MVLVTKTKKPSSVHHRKRVGDHHRKQTKHYVKAYWPYLPMLGLAGLGVAIHLLLSPPHGSVLSYATNVSLTGLLQETNSQRSSNGASELIINTQLTSAAQAKANDMASRNYWSHVTPDGREPWWFVTQAGYSYTNTGENLAYGFDSSSATISGWMNSPSHRANLLNTVYQEVGFGIADVADYQGHGPQTVIVALYGKPAAAKIALVPAKPVATPASGPAAVQTAAGAPNAADSSTAQEPQPILPVPTTKPKTEPAVRAAASNSIPAREFAASQPVSRLQLLTPTSALTVVIIALLSGAAAAVFVLRHAYFWHKALVKGERFFIKHWKLDLAVITVVVVASLLTRTAGFIQ